MPFEDRVRLAVDDVYSSFTDSTVAGLIRRAGLRYPNADLRRIDMLGSGKSYLGGVLPRVDRTARLLGHRVEARQEVEGGATDPQG